MTFTKNKSATLIFPIVLFTLVLTSCQKTQEESSQGMTEEMEVYKQNGLSDELKELAD
ncbi:MAG: hypothetical protein ACTH5M_01065 [Psychrobacter sp.]|uniref:hypothetical protein n=1 Tax=Psychrobacter sp. AOP7-B1-24 TaxID=3457645 RepID=UPI003FB92CC1